MNRRDLELLLSAHNEFTTALVEYAVADAYLLSLKFAEHDPDESLKRREMCRAARNTLQEKKLILDAEFRATIDPQPGERHRCPAPHAAATTKSPA